MAWTQLVDMAMDDEAKIDMVKPMPLDEVPDYPFGLRICLTQEDLDKLGLDADCEVGDLLDMRCFATVTSVSKNEVNGKPSCRVELQIEKIAVENEMDEDDGGY